MIRFLDSLLNVFGWRKRKVEPYDEIRPDEQITRYLFHRKRQFNENSPTEESRVKYTAFQPGRDSKVSVYRTDGLSKSTILAIGDKYVASLAGKPIRAWAALKAETILNENLSIEPDGIPHPRHANIADWPNEDAKKKMLQVRLASRAELVLAD